MRRERISSTPPAQQSVMFGSSLVANMFMFGFAFQHGGLLLSAETVEKAIGFKSEAVTMNVSAFRRGGRRAVHKPEFGRTMIGRNSRGDEPDVDQTLDEMIARRSEFMKAHQNASYAERYIFSMASLCAIEQEEKTGSTVVTESAACSLFKLIAIKDEYDVAQLYTDGLFQRELAKQFQCYDWMEFHFTPPILSRKGAEGIPHKSSFGPWMMKGSRVCSRRLWLHRRAAHGALVVRPLRGRPRSDARETFERQSGGSGSIGIDAAADPRLWPRQVFECREGIWRTRVAGKAIERSNGKSDTASCRIDGATCLSKSKLEVVLPI